MPPALVAEAESCLEKAITATVTTQRDNGSWAVPPSPRILDTAITACALSAEPEAAQACFRARAWLQRAAPQRHEEFTRVADEWLRRLALNPAPPSMPTPLHFEGPYARRALLLHALGVSAGSDGVDAWGLLHKVAATLGADRGRTLKGWLRTTLLAIEIITQSALGLPIPPSTLAALESDQTPAGCFDPLTLTTAVAYLALTRTAPARASTRRCLTNLLTAQQPDGTWRFPTFDVWDTSLIVRCLRGHPTFDRHAHPRALDFLEKTQSADGGWGGTSAFAADTAFESDNDTTGAVLLALARTAPGHRAWPAAAAYARSRQNAAGLWTTWQSTDDTPTQDVVAHMVAGVHAHNSDLIGTAPAIDWLTAKYHEEGRWRADWYTFPAYAVTEIAPVIGWHSPESQDAVRQLLESQNHDGAWPSILGEDHPSPAATGLAISALAISGAAAPTHLIERAIRYLVDSQRTNGTWTEEHPFMYGPRPFLTGLPAQAHAMTCRGIRDLLALHQHRPHRYHASPDTSRPSTRGPAHTVH